jgi:hypothetical protein
VQLIHQIGQHDIDTWHTLWTCIKLFDYKSNLSDVVSADVIICRSGAEHYSKQKTNKTMHSIPLETTATDHQLDNAKK